MKTFKPLGGACLQFFVFPPNVLLRVRREGQEPCGAARRGGRGHAAGPGLGLHRGQRPHHRGQRGVPATGRQPPADDTSHRGVFPQRWSQQHQILFEIFLQVCCDFLQSQLDVVNCLEIKEFASLYSCHKLVAAAEEFAGKAFEGLLDGDSPEILSFTEEELSQWISEDSLLVHEDRVASCVLDWVNHSKEERRECLPRLLKHIRIPFLSESYKEQHFMPCIREVSPDSLQEIDLSMAQNSVSARTGHDEMILVPVQPGNTLMGRNIQCFDVKKKTWSPFSVSWRGPSFDNHLPVEAFEGRICVINGKLHMVPGEKDYPFLQVDLKTKKMEMKIPGNRPFRPWSKEGHEIAVARLQDWPSGKYADKIIHINCFGSGVMSCHSIGFTHDANYTSTKFPSPKTSRFDMGVATMLKDGGEEEDYNIYVVGGMAHDGTFIASVEVNYTGMSTSNGDWRYVASMSTPRANPAVTVVDGFLYAIGGVNAEGILSSGERYDPEQNTWSPIAPMSAARFGAGVVAAPGAGGVVVVGGYNSSGVLRSLERYSPATDTWATLEAELPGQLYGTGACLVHKYNL